MTIAWQKQAPGSVNAAGPKGNGHESTVERFTSFSWEDWFHHASPQQRSDALGLAHQQGLLYPHQLPVCGNGVKTTGAILETPASQTLFKLLAGKTATVAPCTPESLRFFDSALDDLQRQAVQRAFFTPDIFLLQGLPGSGKSRVIAEILHQCACAGQRVLFLAGHAASVDVVLERLVGRPEVFALRTLGATEKVETLPAWLRGFTLEEQKQAFLERVLAGARQNREQFETSCRQRSEQSSLWAELRTCAEHSRTVNEKHAALQAKLPSLAEAVERELAAPEAACALAMRVKELHDCCGHDLKEWETSQAQRQESLSKCVAENLARTSRLAELAPAYQAKKNRQFFAPAYWMNLFNGSVIADMEKLLAEQGQAQLAQAELQKQVDDLAQRVRDRRAQFEQERAALVNAEVESRRETLANEVRAIENEQRSCENLWSSLCDRLNLSNLEKTGDAITAAQQVWQTHKKQDEQQCQFARQWTEFVESAGPDLALRLPSLMNVVAGTTQRWQSDAKLREACGTPFDLVIIEDADALADADLQKLARFAQRCVLVSDATAECIAAPKISDPSLRRPAVSTTSWSRLWQALGGDAWCRPYRWRRDQNRLVCELLPLASEDHAHLESEGLADSPDIELRILHTPNATPRLAQVIFGSTSFADAFAFVMREIEEFPLEPLGITGWWEEDSDCVRINFGHQPDAIESWLPIEAGLRVGTWMAPDAETPRIACIVFDHSAGWDRVKAAAWLQEHRAVQDLERTVFLQKPYRFAPQLAKFVQTVIRTNDWRQASATSNGAAANPWEFIAVPAVPPQGWPREGAGLELDLSGSRHADRLPVGLRQGLPASGFANYLEAQALIRRLETWSEKESQGQSCKVAVLALYQGQVDLLRRLIEQSAILRACSFPLEVMLPCQMKQRECDIVFLSMTRSHGHRATAFGEAAEELPIALTRASKRLFLFGDPGTLNRRTNWTGPVDQLDSNAASQELLRIKRLVACLQLSHDNGNGKA